MSKLPGLSLIAKDVDITNREVLFMNTNNTNSSEPIFIAGTAIDEVDSNTSKKTNIAHGKFSKLSLVTSTSSYEIEAVNESSDIQKGEKNYIYVDIETGQLKTNSFSDLFENHILNINTTATLVLKDSTNQNVTLTGEELKELIPLIPQIKNLISSQ